MNIERISGILLIAGIVFLILGGVIAPPRVYAEQDLESRLEIISNYQSRWLVTHILGVLGALSTAAGFVLLSIHLWASQNRALLAAGAAAFILATLALSLQSYLRVRDPATALASMSPVEYAWLGLTLAGVLIYGLSFIGANYPIWLAYFSIGSALVLAVGAALTGFFTGEFIYLVTLVIGIVIVVRS